MTSGTKMTNNTLAIVLHRPHLKTFERLGPRVPNAEKKRLKFVVETDRASFYFIFPSRVREKQMETLSLKDVSINYSV